jgi:hypothetical protein
MRDIGATIGRTPPPYQPPANPRAAPPFASNEETDMAKLIHLAPHDPIPEPGAHALVLRRMGEDDPMAVVTEVIFYGPQGSSTPAHKPDGSPMTIEEAVQFARAGADRHNVRLIYVLDRTKGEREQEVIRAHGAHNFAADVLSDTDPEDNEPGSDIRDRPRDAGFLR